MANRELIRQVAHEFDWTQIDVQRAIEASQDQVTTRDEIIVCIIRYAGPELLQRNRQLGAQKRVSKQQKETIADLIDKLTSVHSFYATQMVPKLKATINAQASYISDLLQQVSAKNQVGISE